MHAIRLHDKNHSLHFRNRLIKTRLNLNKIKMLAILDQPQKLQTNFYLETHTTLLYNCCHIRFVVNE